MVGFVFFVKSFDRKKAANAMLWHNLLSCWFELWKFCESDYW